MTTVRFPIGKALITVDAKTVKDAIKEFSEYAEEFIEMICGACESTEVVPLHRLSKGYEFYEMHCMACGAALSFGQTKEGERLFPKRKDKDGNAYENDGWRKYQYTKQDNDDRF
mgnify:CR=1 FL=1